MADRNNYKTESFILGLCIILGLSLVDIKVTVNVADKPIITSAEEIINMEPSQ